MDFATFKFNSPYTLKILKASLLSTISTNVLLSSLYMYDPNLIENPVLETFANYGLFGSTNYTLFTIFYLELSRDKIKDFKTFSKHKSAVFGVNYLVNYSAPVYLFSKATLDILTDMQEWQTSAISGLFTIPFPFIIAYSWDNKDFVLNKIKKIKNSFLESISENFPSLYDKVQEVNYELKESKDFLRNSLETVINHSKRLVNDSFPMPDLDYNSISNQFELERLQNINRII
jgi:hypothetical protein